MGCPGSLMGASTLGDTVMLLLMKRANIGLVERLAKTASSTGLSIYLSRKATV